MNIEMRKFPKIPRYNRDIIITEKIDGTNGQIRIDPVKKTASDILRRDFEEKGWKIIEDTHVDWAIIPASRNRHLTLKKDHYDFVEWVYNNADKLIHLGPGRSHYGEWWGQGIQRKYGMEHKQFTLFNPYAYKDAVLPTVPILYEGPNDPLAIEETLYNLKTHGSVVAPGYMNPEGIVIFHTAANQMFKITFENDESHKSMVR